VRYFDHFFGPWPDLALRNPFQSFIALRTTCDCAFKGFTWQVVKFHVFTGLVKFHMFPKHKLRTLSNYHQSQSSTIRTYRIWLIIHRSSQCWPRETRSNDLSPGVCYAHTQRERPIWSCDNNLGRRAEISKASSVLFVELWRPKRTWNRRE